MHAYAPDPSCSSGIKAQFFSKLQRDLPGVSSVGDVVVLSGMKVSSFGGEFLLLSSLRTGGEGPYEKPTE